MPQPKLLPWGILLLLSLFAPSCGGGGSASSGGGAPPPPPPPQPPPPPVGANGLPTTFRFGLGNGPGDADWMTTSGAAWSYRYQYLSGNVSGGNWSQWNSPAGEFAKIYMNESKDHGYIPVLTYYCMAQSGGEGNLAAMTNTGLMWNYFNNWKLLMQKAGEFDAPVVIHHEPDLWAYMQMQKGDDPANVPVAVTSSGFTEVQGQPDTAIGFARALVALRNTLAPKARIAFHASNFATNTDITFGGDAAALGTRVANFFNALGAGYDLLFNDFTDRDAGYYASIGQPRPWNDATFERSRLYLATLSASTGKKILLWQVPCGNTLYRSCNNTSGHYQSNHAEYFLKAGNRQRIVDWAASGIIGMMFGSTLAQTTSYMDARGDHTTNPSPINGNTVLATVDDDDGGFLRSSAGQYDANPVTLP